MLKSIKEISSEFVTIAKFILIAVLSASIAAATVAFAIFLIKPAAIFMFLSL